MFEKPWLRENIGENLVQYMYTYLTTRAWVPWMLIVFMVLAIVFWSVRKSLKQNVYEGSFGSSFFAFDKRKKSDLAALLFCMTALGFAFYYFFGNENTLFENYDLMAFNTTRSLFVGLVPSFDFSRIAPLASWEITILYAISHNMIFVKIFIALQLILITYLLYRLFDNIEVCRRLCAIGLFLLAPAMICTSSIIFPERDLIIAILLSLICAKKYVATSQLKWAVGFICFANIALYTKETATLFYFGMVAASVIYNIWQENISLRSLLTPWRFVSKMPLEFLLCVSLFLFATIYFLLVSYGSNYATKNTLSIVQALLYYKVELVVLSIAAICLIVNALKFADRGVNPLFGGGLIVGALFICLGIVLMGRLVPQSPHLNGHTYYLVVAVMFALFYIAANLCNKYLFGGFVGIFLCYALVTNIVSIQHRKGVYYREVAEFLVQKLNKQNVNYIHVEEKDYANYEVTSWVVDTYSTAYFYYFNDYTLVFKSRTHTNNILKKTHRSPKTFYFWMQESKEYNVGDWVIVNKEMFSKRLDETRKKIGQTPDYENKLFEVYLIK